ncbi:MAG: lanthionine synthetase C family protein, partial [Gemmataceae bacterium]|nr:lanthionine synthetase C family protein [Gemmataceae bacterium]
MPTEVRVRPSPGNLPGTTGRWQPLLEGDWKQRALETVAGIADSLCATVPATDSGTASQASLAGGSAGLAILSAYLAQADFGPDEESTARRHLAQSLAAVAEVPVPASLYGGLAGVAWAAAHLEEQLAADDTEDVLTEIDETLAEHLECSPWTENYDLISGLVGFGVYALERLPRPAAVACLERVVEHLADTAQWQGPGVTWWTNPAWCPADTRYPNGCYNLGLAHGVPGVIALLGQACAAGIATARARPLLDGAVRWLLSQQKTEKGRIGFPALVVPGRAQKLARAAWCYGEPGIAAALLGAARAVGEPAWERLAVVIARRAAELPPEQAGVVDAGLCHGAAGLGHLFNRMYQATGDPRLGEAAQYWFRRTLELRHPDRGIAGYAAWRVGVGGVPDWQITESSGALLAGGCAPVGNLSWVNVSPMSGTTAPGSSDEVTVV